MIQNAIGLLFDETNNEINAQLSKRKQKSRYKALSAIVKDKINGGDNNDLFIVSPRFAEFSVNDALAEELGVSFDYQHPNLIIKGDQSVLDRIEFNYPNLIINEPED